jgi:hypothetical protein
MIAKTLSKTNLNFSISQRGPTGQPTNGSENNESPIRNINLTSTIPAQVHDRKNI